MSDETPIGVRVRIGDKEIEVRCDSSSDPRLLAKLDELIELFTNSFGPSIRTHHHEEPSVAKPDKPLVPIGRKSKGGPIGGPRRASISKGVDDLIKAQWIVEKALPSIVMKLKERYPGANLDNTLHTLKRRLNKQLTRTLKNGEWLWSVIEK